MKKQERTIAIVLIGVSAFLVLWFILDLLIFKDASTLDDRADNLIRKTNEMKKENRQMKSYEKKLRTLLATTYGDNELKASEDVRDHVLQLVEESGLSNRNLSVRPLTGRTQKGIYREIGKTLNARGKLEDVIDFMYLLSADKKMHRLDSISLSPEAYSDMMRLQLRYMTLVPEKSTGKKMSAVSTRPFPSTSIAPSPLPDEMFSPDRKKYDPIAIRDIFRPYLPKKPVPVLPTPQPTPIVKNTPEPDPIAVLKIVGLPKMGQNPEIYVKNISNGTVKKYNIGEELAGGKIVMVDYRPMPAPGKPQILSGSRVILRVADKYWAVELGQELSKKYQLDEDHIPAGLKNAPG